MNIISNSNASPNSRNPSHSLSHRKTDGVKQTKGSTAQQQEMQEVQARVLSNAQSQHASPSPASVNKSHPTNSDDRKGGNSNLPQS
jgi:hypothetical protein